MSETVTAPAIDKSSWGPGPWQDEPDRVDWIHAGLACFALRNPDHGHFCGYVGVPREHPVYGKEYGEVDLDVHGGVDYSGPCEGEICHVPAPGMPDDVWWLGFDCAHACDLSPARRARMRWVKEEGIKRGAPPEWAKLWDPTPGGRLEVYRALPYVRRECERLAEQLAALNP